MLEYDPIIDTLPRDIANGGEDNPGSTVLADRPQFAGTYSKNYDRVLLRLARTWADGTESGAGAQNFVDQLKTRYSRGPHSRLSLFHRLRSCCGDLTSATLG